MFAGHFVGFLTPLPLLHALGITPPVDHFLTWTMGLAAEISASTAHRDGELVTKVMHYVQHLLLFGSDALGFIFDTPGSTGPIRS